MGKNQISQAQFRARSAVPAVVDGEKSGEEISCARVSGNVQARADGASGENWVREEETGAVETGGGSGMEWLAAQQHFAPPQWQQECAAPATLASEACDWTRLVHASTRLQTMASAVFMG